MLLHGDLKSRVVVAAVAMATAFASWPNAQAAPRSKAVTEEASITKDPKKTKRRGDSKPAAVGHRRATPRGWTGHRPAWRVAGSPVKPSRVAIVLALARAQLGKPYVWAGMGPSYFDCSGLTKFVWHAAGVDLPHNSWEQQSVTKAVPTDKMKPGDLVFYPGHVGIYVGGGKMIHAPHSGASVEVAPLQSNLIGAGRPA